LTDDSAMRLLKPGLARHRRGHQRAVISAKSAGTEPISRRHRSCLLKPSRGRPAPSKSHSIIMSPICSARFLHLVGHDHERDKDAAAMEHAETDILRQLAIPDPYRPRKQTSRQKPGQASGQGLNSEL